MHCDESDDPLSRHIETLTYHTSRLGMHGQVAGSHLTSMHSVRLFSTEVNGGSRNEYCT